MHKKLLSLDIETRSDVDLPKHGVYNYVNTPHFRLLWLSYSYDYGPVQTIDLYHNPLPDFIVRDLQDPEIIKCAANATFERICFSRVLGVYLDPAHWTCTLVLAGRNGLPMHLDGAAFHSGVAIQKDSAGKDLIMTFSVPQEINKKNPWRQWINPHHEPEKWAHYGRYNNQDVGAEMAVKQANTALPVSRAEDMLYTLDQRINDRGIKIDRQLVQQAMAMGSRFKAEITNRVIELTGIKNPNSVQQLVKWLNEETDLEKMAKLPGKTVQKLVESLDKQINETDQIYLPNETVGKLLVKTPPHIIKEVLECRLMLGKASISKYTAMNKVVGWDDRIRGILQFYGANRTGRWAGRGVQPQNLTKHKTTELDKMRNAIKSGDMELVRSIEPNVASALSQCIRTAFIPDPGHQFLISDYSAIEARVTAWLANETWRLDFFHQGGDIYVESAARMFKLDPKSIDKKTYEGAQMRARGKISELGLGFLGGVGALKQMGEALGMEIPEHERQPIVDAWREASPNIVEFGYDLERAAIRAIVQPERFVVAGKTQKVQFVFKRGNLYMILPSGRWLTYQKAFIGTNKFGKPGIFYYESKNKGWHMTDTYSGKLIENCLTCDTEVLTKESGWIKITDVTVAHRLWDGLKWVNHDGLIYKGERDTIRVDGVGITPEHLILTNHGWKTAIESPQYARDENSRAYCDRILRLRRAQINLEIPLRLRKRENNARFGISKREIKIVRLPALRYNCRKTATPRTKQTPAVRSVALDESSLLQSQMPRVSQLRRQGDYSMRPLAGKVRKFLGRYVSYVRKRFVDRKDRCERRLRTGKLHVERPRCSVSEQARERLRIQPVGHSNSFRGFRAFRNRSNYASVSPSQLPRKRFICRAGSKEPVYDLVNAGDLHRFTVRSATGLPFIVHNCVQATARDVLAGGMLRLDYHGFKIALHVHDEAAIEEPVKGRTIEEVNHWMCQKSAWYQDLPLEASGFVSPYYKKDDN